LEHHDKWSRFYSALDLVAINESHTYTGIEGMHVAWILRRMRRVTEYWGGDPQYVLTSATIGNPRAHSTELINDDVTVVDEDGSPHGPRDIILWNPPPRDTIRDTEPDDDTLDFDDGTTAPDDEDTEEFVAVPAGQTDHRQRHHGIRAGVGAVSVSPIECRCECTAVLGGPPLHRFDVGALGEVDAGREPMPEGDRYLVDQARVSQGRRSTENAGLASFGLVRDRRAEIHRQPRVVTHDTVHLMSVLRRAGR